LSILFVFCNIIWQHLSQPGLLALFYRVEVQAVGGYGSQREIKDGSYIPADTRGVSDIIGCIPKTGRFWQSR
jgi:hypothetical protein